MVIRELVCVALLVTPDTSVNENALGVVSAPTVVMDQVSETPPIVSVRFSVSLLLALEAFLRAIVVPFCTLNDELVKKLPPLRLCAGLPVTVAVTFTPGVMPLNVIVFEVN